MPFVAQKIAQEKEAAVAADGVAEFGRAELATILQGAGAPEHTVGVVWEWLVDSSRLASGPSSHVRAQFRQINEKDTVEVVKAAFEARP